MNIDDKADAILKHVIASKNTARWLGGAILAALVAGIILDHVI